MSKTILLLDGNCRQILPVCESLSKNGYSVFTVSPKKFSYGSVTRWSDKTFILDDPSKDPNSFYNQLLQLIRKVKVDLIIPLFDYSATILSKNKEELNKYSKVAVNDYDVFLKARDKSITMEICQRHNISSPKTYFSGINYIPENIINNIIYPVVIKPIFGESSKGFNVINSKDELIDIFKTTSEKYGKCLIQEYIPQDDIQYKCEMYIDRDNDLITSVVFSKNRWYPIEGGSSTFNLTVQRDDIVDTCYRLLMAIGWKGYADIDLIQDPRDNTAKVMEINPRITGSVKLAFDAGVDFAKIIVDDNFGEKPKVYEPEIGMGLRLFHKDILWFIKSKNRFKSKPSWFNFKNSSDQIISFSDPLPTIVATYEGLNTIFKLKK